MKFFAWPVLILLSSLSAHAQTFYKVTHTSGTKQVGVNTVTVVSAITAPPYCNIEPYCLGCSGPGGFQFKFALPVTSLRIELGNIGNTQPNVPGETMGVEINGVFYPVGSGALTAINPCGTPSPLPLADVDNGYITNKQFGSNKFARVDIHPGYFIDSVKLFYVDGNNTGANCSFYFASDPHVYTATFLDTIMCTGDSVQIHYLVSDIFSPTNIFSIQLSDASGNFANGTIIGSIHDTLPGKIICKIPTNATPGAGYRYRVIASMPADTSAVNPEHLRISDYPSLTASANGPLCNGDILELNAVVDTTDTQINWAGPGGVQGTTPTVSFVSQLKNTGTYTVTANKFSCKSTATVFVQVNPIPAITSIQNNSPICEGKTLQLSSTASDTAVKYNWSGPGFSSNLKAPSIFNVPYSANGTYSVTATLSGCTSPVDSTVVTINPRPVAPQISANTPLSPAKTLQFHIDTTTGATYSWTGPNNFSSTEPNPFINEVDVNAEGKYDVAVTLGVCKTSASINIDVLQDDLHYILSPNPGNGKFLLQGNYGVDGKIPIAIFNSMGQVVYQTEIATANKFLNATIDMNGRLSYGVYLLKVKLKDKTLTTRFTIMQ